MQEYDITITETLEKVVSVMAESKEAAMKAVKDGYYNSEYVLDADNFTEVGFTAGEGHEPVQDASKIEVLLVKPGEFPQRVQIGTELETLQAMVGGDIQVVYPYDDAAGIVCNEEGKLSGLPLNRALRDEDGQVYDVLAGDFLVVGLTEEDFGSLTSEQMEKYEGVFHTPEAFVKMGRGLMVLPIDDETVKSNTKEKGMDAAKRTQPNRDEI